VLSGSTPPVSWCQIFDLHPVVTHFASFAKLTTPEGRAYRLGSQSFLVFSTVYAKPFLVLSIVYAKPFLVVLLG